MCGIPAKIGKLLLFTINFAVWICGAVIMGVGIALAVDDELWSEWLELAGDGMNDDLFAAAVYMMIGIGVLLFLVGFLGCCGVCKGNTCMLQTYIIIVSILLIIELVGGILAIVFKDSLSQDMKDSMYNDIQNEYKPEGVNSTDGTTQAWNSMQVNLECCGAYNFTDYEGSIWSQGNSDPVPVTCCKGAAKIGSNFYTISEDDKEACFAEASTPTDDYKALYARGCYAGLDAWIGEKSDIIIGVLIGLGAVQLFGLIGACCVKSSLEEGE